MQETTKLKLKKPDGVNYVNIEDLNFNADAIDQFAVSVEEQLTNVPNLEASVADLIVHVGELSTLTTDEKTSLVGAINEVFTKINAVDGRVTTHEAEDATGAHKAENINLTSTNFTATDVKAGMDELFTNVSNGKNQLETVITDKGGEVSKVDDVASFNELESGVLTIPTGGQLKSVQRGHAVINHTELTTTVEISRVDINKAFLVFTNTLSVISTESRRYFLLGNLDSTSITFSRGSHIGNVDIDWMVIEFDSGASVQQVTGALTNGDTKTDSVSPVDLNKSFIVGSFYPLEDASVAYFALRFGFESETSVRVSRGYGSSNVVNYTFFVVEFE